MLVKKGSQLLWRERYLYCTVVGSRLWSPCVNNSFSSVTSGHTETAFAVSKALGYKARQSCQALLGARGTHGRPTSFPMWHLGSWFRSWIRLQVLSWKSYSHSTVTDLARFLGKSTWKERWEGKDEVQSIESLLSSRKDTDFIPSTS